LNEHFGQWILILHTENFRLNLQRRKSEANDTCKKKTCLSRHSDSVFTLNLFSISSLAANDDAKTWVRKAAEAKQNYALLKASNLKVIGHKYWLEQSERPEGHWIIDYQQITEIRDLSGKRLRQTAESKNFQMPK
jgi:hypothetical protein